MNTVFESCAQFAERHAGAVELSLVSDLSRRKPDGEKGSQVDESSEALGIELVGFIDVAHNHLGLRCMSQ
jgi:hypothetical protein